MYFMTCMQHRSKSMKKFVLCQTNKEAEKENTRRPCVMHKIEWFTFKYLFVHCITNKRLHINVFYAYLKLTDSLSILASTRETRSYEVTPWKINKEYNLVTEFRHTKMGEK